MSGRLTRTEYDECFAKLFGSASPLRRAPIEAVSPWRAFYRFLTRVVRGGGASHLVAPG
jgi:hypothetical protein